MIMLLNTCCVPVFNRAIICWKIPALLLELLCFGWSSYSGKIPDFESVLQRRGAVCVKRRGAPALFCPDLCFWRRFGAVGA